MPSFLVNPPCSHLLPHHRFQSPKYPAPLQLLTFNSMHVCRCHKLNFAAAQEPHATSPSFVWAVPYLRLNSMSQSMAATGVLIGPPNFEHPHPSLFHIRQHLLLRSTPKIDSLIIKSGLTSTLSPTSQYPSQNGLGHESQTRPRQSQNNKIRNAAPNNR